MKTLKSLLDKENFWFLFILLCLLNMLSIYVIHQIVITDPLYFTGGNARSASLYKNIWLIINVAYPALCFIKLAIIAGLLQFGLKNRKIEVPFKQLISLAMLGQIVFWIQDFAQMVWFLFIHTGYTMKEVDNFSFFSLQFFIKPEANDSIKAMLNFFSIPQILFWLALIVGLQLITKESLKRMAKQVFLTYGLASFLFLLGKVFFLYKTNS